MTAQDALYGAIGAIEYIHVSARVSARPSAFCAVDILGSNGGNVAGSGVSERETIPKLGGAP
jgi:hypothetical protein